MKFAHIIAVLTLPLSISCIPNDKLKRMELPPKNDKRQTLLFDMDETLVHAETIGEALFYAEIANRNRGHPVEHLQRNKEVEGKLLLLVDGGYMQVSKRPGLDSFLEEFSKKYELVLYSAGRNDYATAIVNWIDPKQEFFKHRYYRDYCVTVRDSQGKISFRKLLEPFGRTLDQIFAVDDTKGVYIDNPENQIVIPRFLGDSNDKELEILSQLLEGGLSVEKVAQINKDYLLQ